MAAEADADTLQKQMAGTYHNLRLGVGLIGITLPVVLWPGGMLFDREALRWSRSSLEPSIFSQVVIILVAFIQP